ncbi:MAG: VOC family protein [Gammaproteobacteria bacterium]
MLTPFHVAVQVRDIEEARDFYGRKLGFPEGRSAEHWVDFDMFGHQFVVHLNPALAPTGTVGNISNPVDGDQVPVPHCGVVLELPAWEALAERVRGVIDAFVIEPHIRFKGQAGEQGTMFFLDPSGNALEFKTFRNITAQLFAR